MEEEYEVVALRIAFQEGLVGLDDVRAWVERELSRRSELPAALLELSTLAGKSHPEVANLLRALEPDVPAAVHARLALALLAARFASERLSLHEVVARLYTLARFGDGLSDGERERIYGLEAELGLADEGTYGKHDDVRAHVDAFLLEYATPLMPPHTNVLPPR